MKITEIGRLSLATVTGSRSRDWSVDAAWSLQFASNIRSAIWPGFKT
jgi:hypothetical protein